jgi:type II secretory pathway pseudopilin PulG
MNRQPTQPDPRAFTLVETLVAIGAVALISVGIAAIFQSVGRTVSTGRRISNFTQVATLVERQMRNDFARMTRDGYLVIHHQYASDLAGERIQVLPYDGAPASAAAERRIDEILFFAKGDFTSAREPMAPGVLARSGNAAIYYGHGALWPVGFDSVGGVWSRPELNSIPLVTAPLTLGYKPTPLASVEEFPNQHSSAWNLLRHVTLLAPLASTETRYAPNGAYGFAPDSAFLIDQDTQIALQPAAVSLFRTLSRMNLGAAGGPMMGGPVRPLRESATGGPITRRVIRSTGLADIATTDLAEVRSISQSMAKTNKTDILAPGDIPGPGPFEDFRQQQIEEDANDPINRPGSFNQIPKLTQANINSTSSNPDKEVLANIHNWMREAFPANSFGDPSSLAADDEAYIRMRAEPVPPDYFGAASLTNELERAYRRADQLMLTSGIFVPRCSEFIVEWTFGQADTAGRLVWFGGKETPGIVGNTIRLYPGLPSLVTDNTSWYRPFSSLPSATAPLAGVHRASPYLIYDDAAIANFTSGAISTPSNAQATAHFGYIDPTWPGGSTPPIGEPRTLPWAWPKLIRVTMTLVDPVDPSIQESFQFVLDVPADPMP